MPLGEVAVAESAESREAPGAAHAVPEVGSLVLPDHAASRTDHLGRTQRPAGLEGHQPIRQPEPVVADGLGPAGEQAVGAAPIREREVLDDQLGRLIAVQPHVGDRHSGGGPLADHPVIGAAAVQQVRGPVRDEELAVVDGRPEVGRAEVVGLLLLVEAEDAVKIQCRRSPKLSSRVLVSPQLSRIVDPLLTENEVSTTPPVRLASVPMRRALIGIAAAAALLATAAASGGGTAASSASADKDCSDFANQAQAQSYFTSHGGSASNDFDNLDADHDGVACESLPCPCSSSAGSGGGGGGGGQTAPKAKRVSARVVAAVDGDTLKVDLKNGEEWDVRLIGIDTPETVRPNTPVQCGGPQASTSMHGLADGRRVTLVSDPTQDRIDRYGRLLDYVFRGARTSARSSCGVAGRTSTSTTTIPSRRSAVPPCGAAR